MKHNIGYYPHDVSSHTHWKFKHLRRQFGWEGEGRFWALNNMIGAADGCMIHIDNRNIKEDIAADLGMSAEELDEMIAFLVTKVELLFRTEGYIGTKKTQETLASVNEKRVYQREWKKSKSKGENGKVEIENEKSNIDISETNIEFEQIKGNKKKLNKRDSSDGYSPSSKSPTSKDEKIAKRKKREKDFQQELVPHVATYGKEMIRAFYLYWSEPNKSGGQMKYEMQKTWDLLRRLNTWQKNDDNWTNKQTSNQQQENDKSATTDSRILEKITGKQPAGTE